MSVVAVVVLVGIAAAVISYNSSYLDPAGQLYGPGKCHYETVTGDFLVTSQILEDVVYCEYYEDDNYDPFVRGAMSFDNTTKSERCDTETMLTEYSCLTETAEHVIKAVTTEGTCTLGCFDGACVKTKRVLVCSDPQNVPRAK